MLHNVRVPLEHSYATPRRPAEQPPAYGHTNVLQNLAKRLGPTQMANRAQIYAMTTPLSVSRYLGLAPPRRWSKIARKDLPYMGIGEREMEGSSKQIAASRMDLFPQWEKEIGRSPFRGGGPSA